MNPRSIFGMTAFLVAYSAPTARHATAADHEEHAEEQGKPIQYHPQPTDFSTVAISPSLDFDSALALSGGAAVLVKLSGGCAHVCGGLLALAEGEVGLFGYQVRLGGALSVIGEEFIRHVWFNFTGVSVAAAYLSRTKTFDRALDQREDYLGVTFSGAGLIALRLGVFNRQRAEGRLLTFALGVGF
jgi:hypothetical protein